MENFLILVHTLKIGFMRERLRIVSLVVTLQLSKFSLQTKTLRARLPVTVYRP